MWYSEVIKEQTLAKEMELMVSKVGKIELASGILEAKEIKCFEEGKWTVSNTLFIVFKLRILGNGSTQTTKWILP